MVGGVLFWSVECFCGRWSSFVVSGVHLSSVQHLTPLTVLIYSILGREEDVAKYGICLISIYFVNITAGRLKGHQMLTSCMV